MDNLEINFVSNRFLSRLAKIFAFFQHIRLCLLLIASLTHLTWFQHFL